MMSPTLRSQLKLNDPGRLAAIEAIEAADPATEVDTIQAARILTALGVQIEARVLERLQILNPSRLRFRRLPEGAARYTIGNLRLFVEEQESLAAI